MTGLLIPTGLVIEEYHQQFEADVDTHASDVALAKVFASWPRNDSLDEVLVKVTLLNALYKTNIFAIRLVAQHIQSLPVDEALAEGDFTIIEKIAQVEFDGKRRRNYSFATKYCAWHRPETYPIYDRIVANMLWGYKLQTQFAAFERWVMWDSYTEYVRVYDAFRSYFLLETFSYRQIDKFLWRYGRQE